MRDRDEKQEETKDTKVQTAIVEREITLSLLNDKLNLIINFLAPKD